MVHTFNQFYLKSNEPKNRDENTTKKVLHSRNNLAVHTIQNNVDFDTLLIVKVVSRRIMKNRKRRLVDSIFFFFISLGLQLKRRNAGIYQNVFPSYTGII